MRCPSCDTENAEGSRFCNGCGSALDGPAEAPNTDRASTAASEQPAFDAADSLDGQRRQATVLFADTVGSTKLAESLGESALVDKIDAALARL